jgi:hypothetical protein
MTGWVERLLDGLRKLLQAALLVVERDHYGYHHFSISLA